MLYREIIAVCSEIQVCQVCLFCQVNVCSVVTRFAVFMGILYYSMYTLYYFM
jgi:hypothetical protein